jgi:signal transduction histidine kinase/PleD family two-component response regulator/HPt (histidine-containing phosphotransfer) domain-containing protein
MLNHELISLADINLVPEEEEFLRSKLNEQNIKSLIAIPMVTNDKLIGFFGFDCVKQRTIWDQDEIGNLMIVAGILAETIQKSETQIELQNQNQLYDILSKIAQDFINLSVENVNESITNSLKELAIHSNADRAYIFEYDWQAMACNNTHEWCEQGISPQIEELQGIPLDVMTWWVEKHQKGEALYIADVFALPETDGVREILEPQEVKSLIAIPIMNDNVCTGFVGFDSVRQYHNYSKSEQILLSFYAQLLTNLDKRIKMEEELRYERNHANAASKAKSEFLANMSHEIRTPLNGIIGFTELLLKTKLEKNQLQYAQNVVTSSYSLLGIINDILDFSKIEAGKLELDPIKTDLIELVEHAADIVKYQASQKGLELLLNIDVTVPRFVIADPIRINQILVNLLSNALKFTNEGEVELQLKSHEVDEKEAIFTFSIRDTGIGISDAQKHKLFKAFSQADSSTSRKYGGTGLGLVISNLLANKMDSKIEFVSHEKSGSTFFFKVCLPYEYGSKQQYESLENIKRVLIIDDNTNNRIILKNTLENWDIEVSETDNGITAVKMINSSEPFDVMIVDYHMPVLNGLDTIKMIMFQVNEAHAKIPTILLHSSSDDGSIFEECKRLGVKFVLTKPVRMSELKKHLSRINKIQEIDNVTKAIEMEIKSEELNLEYQAKILVAEDNEMNLALIQELLAQIAPEAVIHTAVNGFEALQAVSLYRPHVVFMDVQMPELDGIETTKHIRNNPNQAIADTTIIALTAGALQNEKTRCLEAGMNEFLTKPVLAEDIKAVLKKYLLGISAHEKISVPKSLELPSNPRFDHRALLKNLSYDVEAFKRVLKISITSLPEKIRQLDSAVTANNATDIRQIAHSIKGSALNLQFKELAKYALDLERNHNSMDYKSLQANVESIKEEWRELTKLVNPILKRS